METNIIKENWSGYNIQSNSNMYFFHTAEQRSSKSVQEKEINENENSVT